MPTDLRVQIYCRNWREDRVIPRMARALSDRLGWELVGEPDPSACDVLYLSGYFEGQKLREWPGCHVAAYFTHREEEPPGNAKALLYDDMAERVDLRIATCRLYGDPLRAYGPTVQAAAPLERDRFVIPDPVRTTGPVVGFSGYTYRNHRKGEDLVQGLLEHAVAERCEWMASGRGWPVTTKRYSWQQMPDFFQGLDVLVVPSRVEGIPMPPLEALACGVSVVVPRGVGLVDELPEVDGIYRYERGDLRTLIKALEQALDGRAQVDREALREATAPYSVEAWCTDHERAFAEAFAGAGAGIGTSPEAERDLPVIEIHEPADRETDSKRGIYCVAFGHGARESADNMMRSAKLHMPDIPICLCAAEPIGVEDVFIEQPDSDIGGRRAKLMAYELAPAEWETVLYLDADTEVIAPVRQLFEWAEDGWDMVICKDIPPNDVLGHIKAKVIPPEAAETQRVVGTWDVLQLNGGVWAFRRNEATAAFFAAWRREWERWAQRDQGALIRALYSHPLKMLVLGNEWNTFPKFQNDQESAGILHFPGEARRWSGQIQGRLDDDQAWAAVRRFETRRGIR